MENIEEYLSFAKDMAYEAGKIMKKYYKEDNGASYKYDQTIVTKADTEINHLLIEKKMELLQNVLCLPHMFRNIHKEILFLKKIILKYL